MLNEFDRIRISRAAEAGSRRAARRADGFGSRRQQAEAGKPHVINGMGRPGSVLPKYVRVTAQVQRTGSVSK